MKPDGKSSTHAIMNDKVKQHAVACALLRFLILYYPSLVRFSNNAACNRKTPLNHLESVGIFACYTASRFKIEFGIYIAQL